MKQEFRVLSESGRGLRITVDDYNGRSAILELKPEGYGECTTLPGYGSPVVLDYGDGGLRVLVWADINSEEPTHTIDLSGALEAQRKIWWWDHDTDPERAIRRWNVAVAPGDPVLLFRGPQQPAALRIAAAAAYLPPQAVTPHVALQGGEEVPLICLQPAALVEYIGEGI